MKIGGERKGSFDFKLFKNYFQHFHKHFYVLSPFQFVRFQPVETDSFLSKKKKKNHLLVTEKTEGGTPSEEAALTPKGASTCTLVN